MPAPFIPVRPRAAAARAGRRALPLRPSPIAPALAGTPLPC